MVDFADVDTLAAGYHRRGGQPGLVRFNWTPGTRFEYSNLGFAILGRIITAVTGAAYPDYIRDRLLHPLGLTHTGYEAAEFGGGVARGYRRWVAGFAAAFPPGDHGGPHPVQLADVAPEP
ncbi:MAG TPA: serine hydrolase domain-containing protein [Streptosporangiaceae bacterium]|nr:serine hydrolase domain-containing protein [Streptosporangiaceae bacterium]